MVREKSDYHYLSAFNLIKNGLLQVDTVEFQEFENFEDTQPVEIILKSRAPSIEKTLIIRETFENLSDEAKQVIRFILTAPDEALSALTTPKTGKISVGKVRRLIAYAWKSNRKAFFIIREIKQWLRQLSKF